jgi:ApaG protein
VRSKAKKDLRELRTAFVAKTFHGERQDFGNTHNLKSSELPAKLSVTSDMSVNLSYFVLVLLAVSVQFFLTQNEWKIGDSFLDVQQRLVYKLFTERKEQQLVEASQDKPAKQADEIRTTTEEPAGPEDKALKCFEEIGPYSTHTTRDVEIVVESVYRGLNGGTHSWAYHVTFHNRGKDVVQMLTRHWVFVDAHGKVEEVKGPGARGDTPIIHPGGTWNYQSGTNLQTATGSMRGSFQMEVLEDRTGSGPASYSARVARLGLSTDGSQRAVPCGEEADSKMLPTTSVWSTSRVIVGATSEYMPDKSEPKASVFAFKYDVQINNARTHPVHVLRHRWVLTESNGHTEVISGVGLGGFHGIGSTVIAPGDATRYLGMVTAGAASGILEGSYTVAIGPDEEEIEVEIGQLAFSIDGTPVAPITAD